MRYALCSVNYRHFPAFSDRMADTQTNIEDFLRAREHAPPPKCAESQATCDFLAHAPARYYEEYDGNFNTISLLVALVMIAGLAWLKYRADQRRSD